MPRKLGQLESAALALAQMRNLRTMRVGELASGLGISAKQERELLSRMSRSGMIANVRKGLYLFPPRLPLGGIWTPDEATAINALMADKNARYQITGPKAFNRYGYSEQIPGLTTIYNDAISGERRVGSVSLKLIKVARDRLGGVEKVRMPSGETLVYSSRARTLVDAVFHAPPNSGVLVDMVRRKLTIPDNPPVDVGGDRMADLRRQVDAKLKPVLREKEFRDFDLDRAIALVVDMATCVA